MLIGVAVMAVGGFVFNAIAARSVSRDVLGIHASLLFWVLLINQLTSLGLPVTMSRLGRFPARATSDWLMACAFGLTVASSLAGTALFGVFGVGTLRTSVHDALFSHGTAVGFGAVFAVVSGLSLTLLVEIRLVAIGLARVVVFRAVAANVLRLGLLGVAPLRSDPLGLMAINLGSNALLGLIVALWLLRRRRRAIADERPTRANVAEEARTAGVNWVTIAAVQAPQFAVPVIARLNADSNASFYLAWQIMTVVFLVPVVVGHVIVVESAGRGARVARRNMLFGGGVAVTVTGVAALLSVPLGRFATGLLFSDPYRSAGDLLPLLLAAAIPWSITAVLLASTRIEGRHTHNVVIAAIFALSTMTIALASTAHSSTATVQGWFLGNMLAALLTLASTMWFAPGRRPSRRSTTEKPGWRPPPLP